MRKRDENVFSKYLKGVLKGHADVQGIEDKHSPGIPDLNYCAIEVEGWMELKVIAAWPAKPETSMATPLVHLTSEQCNWMLYRSKHGGRVFLFIKVLATQEYLISNGAAARDIKAGTQQHLRDMAYATWKGSVDTDELLRVLTQ